MSNFIALIPFAVLFACFALLRINLLHSAFVALLCCTLFTQTFGHATQEMWQTSLLNTGIFLFEIGVIIFGAFFFIEIARRNHLLDSLAKLVHEITDDRIAQAILVTFPLELMIEGSSGFGTPILMIAPLLKAIGFPILLCATLPFICMVIAIPFGALGTPIRLGFPDPGLDIPALSHAAALTVTPFLILAPALCAYLVYRFDPKAREQSRSYPRLVLWGLLLCAVYGVTNYFVSYLGPEFPGLASAFATFLTAIFTRSWFFGTRPIRSYKGIQLYGVLLFLFWIGKQIWLDQKIPGTPLRCFNPGMVFLIVGTILMFVHRLSWHDVAYSTWVSAKRTLMVFFCMTWIVQQLKASSALENLAMQLPTFLLHEGAPITAWLGTILIGTSTMSNLFLSHLYNASFHPWLAASSAVGVQLAFQSVTGVRSILKDEIEERAIFRILAPISISFMLILSFALWLKKVT